MSRLTLAFALAAAFLLGAAVGVTVARASAPAVVSQPAARPTAEPAPVGGDLLPGGRPVVPEPGLPVVAPASMAATAAPVAVPVGHRSDPVHIPRTVAGIASWFAAPATTAAAGPSLRRALGRDWRGSTVTVCAAPGASCAVVTITDWCRCPGGRVIDLSREAFAILAPLSRGLVHVVVRL